MDRLDPPIGVGEVAADVGGGDEDPGGSRGVRGEVGAAEVLRAVALLCLPVPGDGPGDVAHRVAVFVDGLRRVG